MRKSYRRANFHLLMMIVGKLMSYQSFLIVAAQLHFPSFRGACSSCSTSSTELEMQILFGIGSWELGVVVDWIGSWCDDDDGVDGASSSLWLQ